MGLALLAVTAALVEPAGGQVQYTHPSWSPRGDLIAFDSDLSGEYHIWVVRPDGSGLRRVTPDGANHSHPSWAPSGELLVFESDRDGDLDIWRMGLDGNDLIRLTNGPSTDAVASWSPDGAWIAYGSTLNGNSDVLMVPAVGGASQRVTSSSSYEGVPRWSPAGSRLAFDKDVDGRREVWVISGEEPHEPTPLVAGSDWVHVAAWAPDGSGVAVTVRTEDDPGDLYYYDLASGMLEEISAQVGWEGAASWSPSGEELVLQRRLPDRWILEVLKVQEGTRRRLF